MESQANISNAAARFRPSAWIVVGLGLILALNFYIRGRLADMPLERDEGEYAYAGQLLRQGIPPYQLAYNMKFPGAYFAYAVLQGIGGASATSIHWGIAVITSLTAMLVFAIGKLLFQNRGGLLAAASYVLLAASPAAFGLAGHATHFIALFTTAGALLLLQAEARPAWWRWGGAGFCFGLAVLMKQHAALMAGAGGLWLVAWVWKNQRPSKIAGIKTLAAYSIGCATPLLLTGIALASAGVWRSFTFWTLQYATQYASAVSIQTAWAGFLAGFGPVFNSGWSLWCLGAMGLGICVAQKAPLRTQVVLILFLGGVVAACPGFHFRGHYFLTALPGLALLIALSFTAALSQLQERAARIMIGAFFCAALGLTGWTNRHIWFELTPAQVTRQLYSLNPFLEAPAVADYLRNHTAPGERIAVIGSEPQIYFYAQRPAATGYIYMYALTEPLPLAERMRREFIQEMETARPRYVVFVDIITSWISLSSADTSVLNWWNEFVQQYEPVGAVQLNADAPTVYQWDETRVRSLNLSDYHLVVYRRKAGG